MIGGGTRFDSIEEIREKRGIESFGIVSFVNAKFSGKAHPDAVRFRLETCNSCQAKDVEGNRLFRSIDGKLYCGLPRLQKIKRDEVLYGCGCELADKASYKASACPLGFWGATEKGEKVCCEQSLFPDANDKNSFALTLINGKQVRVVIEQIMYLNDISGFGLGAKTEIKLFGGASVLVKESCDEINALRSGKRLLTVENMTEDQLRIKASVYGLLIVDFDWPRVAFRCEESQATVVTMMGHKSVDEILSDAKNSLVRNLALIKEHMAQQIVTSDTTRRGCCGGRK